MNFIFEGQNNIISDQVKTKVKSFAKSHNHTQIVNSHPII